MTPRSDVRFLERLAPARQEIARGALSAPIASTYLFSAAGKEAEELSKRLTPSTQQSWVTSLPTTLLCRSYSARSLCRWSTCVRVTVSGASRTPPTYRPDSERCLVSQKRTSLL